ncbi:MAG: type I methionyl aminopeptidase [Actinomycetales bacterium]|nr:type I methionyl aminopeptidase [Actinomycetales bacterium]
MTSSTAPLGTLVPGVVSPLRSVPGHIERPEYVGKDRELEFTGSEVKDAETIEKIRAAGRIAGAGLAEVARHVAPGVTTDELDRIAHEFVCDHGAYPSTLRYRPRPDAREFPKSLCTSVNEVICHGIPDSTVLADGDLVKLDLTAYLDGVHGDTCISVPVGSVDSETSALIERTHESMMRGIKAVAPGRQVNVIGRVIEKYAQRYGYGVVRDFTGHGVGESFHSGLVVPHYDAAPFYDTAIEPGMVFTIEPMLNLGGIEWEMWDDGWTVVTADRSRSAQFEHTIVVTETGAEILTLP